MSRQVVCIYQPPMLGHDHAVGFALHCSVRYFATVNIVLFSVVDQDKLLFGNLMKKLWQRSQCLKIKVEKIKVYKTLLRRKYGVLSQKIGLLVCFLCQFFMRLRLMVSSG